VSAHTRRSSVSPPDLFSQLYDPVYQVGHEGVSLPQESLWSLLDPVERERLDLFHQVLTTAELQRLKSLRQSGFAGLVFPAATHSRYAHSVGTWTLGRLAMEYVHVKSERGVTSLRRHLELGGRDDVAEFLAALLVHDIGHPPFSHVVQANEDFNDILRKNYAGIMRATPHRSVARWLRCQLLSGTHPEVGKRFMEKYPTGRPGDPSDPVLRLAEVLAKYQVPAEGTRGIANVGGIRTFLGCTDACDDRIAAQASTRPLTSLLEGVVALDRLDYYNRDSFYTGVGMATMHVLGVLRHLYLDLTVDPPVAGIWEDGVWHAIELLLLRQSLWKRVFSHPETCAYDAMLSTALSMALRSRCVEAADIPFMEDDDFLEALERCEISRALIQGIKRKRPYVLAHKAVVEDVVHSAAKFREWMIAKFPPDSDSFVLSVPRRWSDEATHWLEGLHVVQGEGGRSVARTVRSAEAKLCDYMEKERITHEHLLMVFAKNRGLAADHEKELRKMLPEGAKLP